MKGRKQYRIRTGARTASKVQEKELIQKAKRLRNHPELILPSCDESCRFCPFEKIRRQLEYVSEHADDKNFLTKFASKGDHLVRAYAATLLLAIKGEVPFLAVFKTPFTEVTFAYRPGCKREKLIGVQYFDNPVLRMIGVLDLIKKKGLYVYSLDDKMVCTGRDPDPPSDFIKQAVKGLKTSLEVNKVKDYSVYSCPHLDAKEVIKEKPSRHPYLRIDWISPRTVISICEKCARHNKENTYLKLVLRIAAKKVHDDFEISLISKPKPTIKCNACGDLDELDINKELMTQYIEGAILDRDLMERHMETFKEHLLSSNIKHYILDNICYGINLNEFLKKLEPDEFENKALKSVLKKVPTAVVVSKVTPNKVLMHYWQEYGRDAIYSITNDRNFSNRMFKNFDINKIAPSQILKESNFKYKQMNIINALPSYDKLPLVAKFADEIARTYKTKGSEDTVRAIEHYRSVDTKIKTVAFAFLLALKKGSSKKWQYTNTEIEFAQFLQKPALKLLKAEPEEYHESLQTLLQATGSTEIITPIST